LCSAALVFAALVAMGTSGAPLVVAPGGAVPQPTWARTLTVSSGITTEVLPEPESRLAWSVELTLADALEQPLSAASLGALTASLTGLGRSVGPGGELLFGAFALSPPEIRAASDSDDPIELVGSWEGGYSLEVLDTEGLEPLGSVMLGLGPGCELAEDELSCTRSLQLVLESLGEFPLELEPVLELHISGSGTPLSLSWTVESLPLSGPDEG